jgi:hypothetical protein
VKPQDLKVLLGTLTVASLLFGIPLWIATQGASLEVEHGVAGGRIENLRWVDDKGEHGGARSLLPGESTSIGLTYSQTGKPFRLRFDLVVDGSRVVLTSRRTFVVAPREEQRLLIDPGFAVTHPMTSPAPSASSQGG